MKLKGPIYVWSTVRKFFTQFIEAGIPDEIYPKIEGTWNCANNRLKFSESSILAQ